MNRPVKESSFVAEPGFETVPFLCTVKKLRTFSTLVRTLAQPQLLMRNFSHRKHSILTALKPFDECRRLFLKCRCSMFKSNLLLLQLIFFRNETAAYSFFRLTPMRTVCSTGLSFLAVSSNLRQFLGRRNASTRPRSESRTRLRCVRMTAKSFSLRHELEIYKYLRTLAAEKPLDLPVAWNVDCSGWNMNCSIT